jgi:hypothetical protein
METLIRPLKQGDLALVIDNEKYLVSPGMRLIQITSSILRAGARLRTPDGVRAANNHSCGCSLFLTNDLIFRRIPGRSIVLLDDVLMSRRE